MKTATPETVRAALLYHLAAHGPAPGTPGNPLDIAAILNIKEFGADADDIRWLQELPADEVRRVTDLAPGFVWG